jgi:hypothetical protein
MYHFCTITTADHLYKTLALRDSIVAQESEAVLHVLCLDVLATQTPSDNIIFYSSEMLSLYPVAAKVQAVYKDSKDKLRWCFKSVFLRYLTEHKADKVVYTDNDIYFHGHYRFLFDLLDEYNFLLTPHHYPRDPHLNQNWLETNFKVGLYNAGFIGVNKGAVSSLVWWAECCAYRCEKNPLRGAFDDQKYLDLIPVMNEKAHIVRHKGCNIAEWNKDEIKRSLKDGKVWLDEVFPLVFIHYNGTTVRAILEGAEPCLISCLDTYVSNLRKYKSDLKTDNLINRIRKMDIVKLVIWKTATMFGL